MYDNTNTAVYRWRAARAAAAVICCAIWLFLAGCGIPAGGPRGSVQAGDNQNGTTVSMLLGETLVVTLNSTYWNFQDSSDPQVLIPIGAVVTSPGSCPPGVGCGTVAQEFRAVGTGTAQVTASRVSCGEALGCTDATGHYKLMVDVAVATH